MDNRRPEFTKRKKELARLEKQKQKLERRAQRDREKDEHALAQAHRIDAIGMALQRLRQAHG